MSDLVPAYLLIAFMLSLTWVFWRRTGPSTYEQVIEQRNQQELEAKRIAQELSERPKVVGCKACGKEVSRTAQTCPHCGENAPGLHIKCPKCGSMSVATGQKGFGLGKAAIGMVLLGPAGLLGGMIGRKKVELVCQACGCKWKPEPKEFA